MDLCPDTDLIYGYNDYTRRFCYDDKTEVEEQLSGFEKSALQTHNGYRQKHGCEPLVINPALSKIARRWARRLLRENVFKHSPVEERHYEGHPCGENLTRVKAYRPDALTGESATKGWYEEISHYNFDRPEYQKGTGHFSQVVWRDTKEMGVGMISKQEGDVWTIIIVANYYPAGNCEGHFSENVSPPHCQ